MEMTNYILQILRAQLMIVWSWGFHNPTAIENGLAFSVSGYKFKGIVKVEYNHGSDLFDVTLVKCGKVVKTIEGIYFDELVNVIDNAVEKVANYKQKVAETYSV